MREGPGGRREEPPGVPGTDTCWVPAGPLGGDHVSGCIPQDQPDVVEFAQVLEPFQEVSHRCFPVHKPLEQRLLEEQHWLGSESERLVQTDLCHVTTTPTQNYTWPTLWCCLFYLCLCLVRQGVFCLSKHIN